MTRARAAAALTVVCIAIGCSHPSVRPAARRAVFPDATVGETRGLVFHVAARSSDSSLERQTRAALTDVLSRESHARIVRLRVFAVGSERLRAVQQLLGHLLTERHLALPALSLIGVHALPQPGQLIEMESIAVQSRAVNPLGVAFLAGLASPSGARTAGGLAKVARGIGVSTTDVVRVSCFYESPDQAAGIKTAIADTFPSAEVALVQSYGASASPAVECEAIARLGEAVAATRYLNLPDAPPSPNFSRAALVSAPRIAFTGTIAADGDSAADMRGLLGRAAADVGALGANLGAVAMAGNYWVTGVARDALRPVRNAAYGSIVPAATGVFVTSLTPPGAPVALELAVPLS
jgi:enamine deaminase RidA (YjgF/YER057c/UK114 family)